MKRLKYIYIYESQTQTEPWAEFFFVHSHVRDKSLNDPDGNLRVSVNLWLSKWNRCIRCADFTLETLGVRRRARNMNTFLYGPRQLLKPTQRGGGRRRFHMNASLLSGFHFSSIIQMDEYPTESC